MEQVRASSTYVVEQDVHRCTRLFLQIILTQPQIIFSYRHTFAAPHITYRSVQTAMRSSRLECFPRSPKSAADFHELMLTEKAAGFREIHGKTFYYGIVGNTVMFVVPATCKALREAGTATFYFDGTYKTSPPMFTQLFMAYAQIGEKVYPLAFMPTENKTATCDGYVQILRKLVSVIPVVTVVGTVTDFEQALMNACRVVFPAATHQGCLFHYKQAVRRYIVCTMKIQPTDPEYTEYRLAMQLPHLPADKIPAGICWSL
nr:uncharacterized protein LOC109400803 isoform X1 [Aedes albopictus]